MFYQFARPFLFKADAESAHNLSLTALKLLPIPSVGADSPSLAQTFAGLHFANPIGLAPGYDKNAEVPVEILKLGFGFTEVGTLTPLPQEGNPKPRLFRLVEDEAVINRMGFNNAGQQAASALLRNIPEQARTGPIGINIGANKDSADRVADYVIGVRDMEALADYLTVNISSPNTPGLRALQDKAALDDLLAQVMAARTRDTPVFLKVAPDLQPADIDDIVGVAMARGIAALIVSNTTISRPALLSRHAGEAGGLSGAPLRDMAQQRIIDFRKASGGQMPLIGVGGIASAQDAYARIRAGASLVQIYSALVYQGPGLARKINKQLARLLQADGFTNITEAIGVDG
ncbi:quinone-dependent dihydroorotate dehydrogenase [Sphingorhabdus wooponensis]|uniref:Dihydroorotate dehydrogenase (quinone) n=1 Tax=Sphingorhabdus wooponensis TaxID=940136 RepID=A0A3R8RCC1_9SPHN|nr:quinone-dependent dihydroorotate dehydrogenase [Sphingorhabdus wooponensis]RRQ51695.1 quinone-dependent dihydroorotate dehydrogenase [Sphingorhabdus wooponensis]